MLPAREVRGLNCVRVPGCIEARQSSLEVVLIPVGGLDYDQTAGNSSHSGPAFGEMSTSISRSTSFLPRRVRALHRPSGATCGSCFDLRPWAKGAKNSKLTLPEGARIARAPWIFDIVLG